MTGSASPNEKEELKALWQSCFHEEQPFLDWFFDERFRPERCMRKLEGGRIVSALHWLPVRAYMRGTEVPVALIAGVATREDARGRGHMREVFSACMRALRGLGIAAVLYHPVSADVYASLGHHPCADAQFVFTPASSVPQGMPRFERACDMRAESRGLYVCYDAFAKRYNCAIARTYEDHAHKLDDYIAGAGRCVAVYDGTDIVGYCVYFNEGDTLYGDECVALSDAAYAVLHGEMSRLAADARQSLRMRLPPDVRLNDAVGVVAPHSLIGAVNVQALLGATGLDVRIPIEVTDSVAPENNGVFLPNGYRTDAPPHIALSAGRLAQWAVGYRSMASLAADGEAAPFHADAVAALDSIGTRTCWLVEEY